LHNALFSTRCESEIDMTMEILGEILKLTVLAGLAIAGILVILVWKKGLATKVTYLRFVIQAASLAAFFYIFTYPIWLLVMLIVVLVMPIVFGRIFCGWICPFAFYMDLITVVRKALKIRHRDLPERLNKFLHNLRYVLLLIFLILPFILILMDPLPSLEVGVVLAEVLGGPFKPLNILLGPIIPLIVPWAGPLVINFGTLGDLNFSYPYVQDIISYTTGIYATIFPLIFVVLTVVGSFAIRRAWCRFCPTGASLAVVNRFKGFKWAPALHLDKDEKKCTKCGICKRVCPVQVTEVYEQKGGKINTSMCMLCLRCVEMCPYEGCLKVKMGGKTAFQSRNWLRPSEID
jgi:ferredoxin-type protein NapH